MSLFLKPIYSELSLVMLYKLDMPDVLTAF